jgi:hypothetical protein
MGTSLLIGGRQFTHWPLLCLCLPRTLAAWSDYSVDVAAGNTAGLIHGNNQEVFRYIEGM